MSMFTCSYCSFRSLLWRELTKHSFECHSNEPNFLEKCKVDGCVQTFCCYSSFNSHISRRHHGVDIEREARRAATNEDTATGSAEEREDERDDNSGAITETDDNLDDGAIVSMELDEEPSTILLNPNNLDGSDRLQRSAALFLLSAKERFHLTQSALNFITQQMQQMVSFAIDEIEETVKKHLHDCRITMELDSQFEALRNPFLYLQTEHLQTKFYRKF